MRVLNDRFELAELAAHGGMGAIWRARDRATGAPVAVKLVTGDGARFAREAAVLARLEHPGIVRYVSHGDASGERFLAMEWLDGEDLAARLLRGPLSVGETFALGARVAEALATAHAAGVVHRDVKPSNIFLVDGAIERVKLVDFGIARDGPATQTATGAVFGTPAYMAPEQARGARDVGARADVFSLGCVLYECLSGQPAFAGAHPLAILGRVLLEEPRPVRELADVPPALDALITRLLSKDPAARPAGGADVALAIAAAAATSGSFTLTSGPSAALTSNEQRLVSVLLVEQPDEEHATTISALAVSLDRAELHDSPADPLADLARRFEARVEHLRRAARVLVVSGAGVATDQAARAARLSLAVRAALPAAHLALATGRGVVGARAPVGEVLDRAARLLRPSHAVLIDEVTAGLLGGRFVVGAEGAALTVASERAHDEPRRLLGRETPMVGRDRELGTLRALFAECVAESVARAVIVTGPAGVGKSRLEHELLRLLDRAVEGGAPVEVWIARGEPLGSGSAFALLGGALRRAAGIESGDAPAARQAKLRARVGRHLAAAEVPRVAELLGEIVGAEFAPSVQLAAARANAELMAAQVRRAFEDLCAAETTAGPLVLVLDDLHWGDLPTVRLVDAALRHCAERPLFVLALARPELDQVFPKLWHARGVQEIRLTELGRRAAERLARHVLGDATDPAIVERVVERAAGNAFFLEELLRGAAAGDSSAPATVLAMLHARLEGLEGDARRVLRAASVFGQAFWRGGVAALLAGEAEVAALWIDELERRELVTHRGTSRFSGEVELTFRHALVRDAAYAMLTDEDRALGHRLAGDWLEAVSCDDALVLAEHRARAGDGPRAAAWYMRAAEQALGGDDLEGAVARAERGIACGATGELHGELLRVRCQALHLLGRSREAVDAGRAALALLPRSAPSWGRAAAVVARALGDLGELDAVEALAADIAAPPLTPSRALALTLAARSLAWGSRLGPGMALLEQAEALGLDDDAVVASICALRGIARAFANDQSRAARLWTESADRWERVGDHRQAALERHNVAGAFLWLGDYPRAERLYQGVEKTFRRMGLGVFVAMLQQNLGYAVFRQGRHAEALELLASSLELCASAGARKLASAAQSYRSMVLLELGDAAGAERDARESLAAVELPGVRTVALGPLADALVALGRSEEALAVLAPGVAFLDAGELVEERAVNVRLAQARALRGIGQADAARAVAVAAHAEIRAAAARIDGDELRACFDAVPEHRAIAELAGKNPGE